MRTALFLLAGVLLLAGALVLGRLFSPNFPGAATLATGAFVALWLALTALNLWTGVAKAGYSVAEELPIFLVLFGIPVAIALLVRWKFL